MHSKLGLKSLMGNISPKVSHLNKTMSFDQHNHLINKNGNSGRLDYGQFKRILEVLSTKVFKDYPSPTAFMDLLKHFILPVVTRLDDKRCIHNKNI